MPYGYIYILENLINGKVYVGQTSKLDERMKAHLGGWSQPPAIASAVKKYGSINFDFSIIQSCSSLEELNEREIYWIAELDCLAPNGYNLKKGGECGGSLSDETKAKISLRKMGTRHTPEARKKIGDAERGSKNHNFGKPMSEETKNKLRSSKLGTKMSEATRLKMSQAALGKKKSAETKAKISQARLKMFAKRRLEGNGNS